MRLLVDTSVLLRWADTGSSLHSVCLDAVRHLVRESCDVCICAQVMIEFWAVSTRPIGSNGLGFDVEKTEQSIEDAKTVFARLPEPPDVADRWQALAAKHNVLGKQVHDTRLVALMLSHGITHLLTLNPRDFGRYPEITVSTPAEILSR